MILKNNLLSALKAFTLTFPEYADIPFPSILKFKVFKHLECRMFKFYFLLLKP